MMIKVHIFHTGSVIVDEAIPYHQNNPAAVTGLCRSSSHRIILPVSCYLIEHPAGKILIDTGWNTIYARTEPKRFLGLLNRISTPVINEDEGIDTKLKALNLTSYDIDAVFFSHLDFDHTSGIPLVQNAKHFYASEEELMDSSHFSFRYQKETWKDIHLFSFQYSHTGEGPFGRSLDVFSDGSVQLVSTSGHTHGHCSARISNGDKYLILAGDSVYTQVSIEKHIIPGFTVNNENAQRSMEWICSCAEDPACIGIFPNHDPAVIEQTIEL